MNRGLRLFLCSLLSIEAVASAETMPSPDLEELVERADVIVLGTVTHVRDLGFIELDGHPGGSGGRLIAGRIAVRRVLKGYVADDSLEFRSRIWAPAVGDLAPGIYGVVLFQRRGRALEFVSDYYPMFRGVAWLPVLARDPLEAVIESVTAIVRAPASVGPITSYAPYDESAPLVILNWGSNRANASRDLTLLTYSALIRRHFDGVLQSLGHSLDDADADVRYNAIRVLTAASGRFISRGEFRNHEVVYRAEWRARLATFERRAP